MPIVLAIIATIPTLVAAGLERPGLGRFDKVGIAALAQFDHLRPGRGCLFRGTVVAILAPLFLPVAPWLIAVVTVAIAVAILLTATLMGRVAVLAAALLVVVLLVALTLFLLGRHLAHRLAQHTGVMLGVLEEVLSGDPVVGQLGIPGEKLILLDDLLRRATHLAFGTGAVEDTIYDVAEGARAVRL